jgi:ornithine cyclodeaminase
MSKIEILKLLDRDPEQILFAVREAPSTGGIFGIKSGGIAKQGVPGSKTAGFWPW